MQNTPSFPPQQPPVMGKQRHGCLTAYLIFMIVANALTAIYYLIQNQLIIDTYETNILMVMLLVVLGIINVGAAILLLKWKKIGFYLFILSALGAFVINLALGLSIATSISGLLGIAILFGVLQIGDQNNKGWPQLE